MTNDEKAPISRAGPQGSSKVDIALVRRVKLSLLQTHVSFIRLAFYFYFSHFDRTGS